MRAFLLSLVFAAGLCAAPGFLPLQEGNRWTYRQRGGTNDFTIQVGPKAVFGDKVYYSLSGYVIRSVFVRFGDDGNLYYRNENLDKDELLTSFDPAARGWAAPIRICEQEGQAQQDRGKHSGPAGSFESTLVILYRVLFCADVGTTSEQYAENIGMVERTITTFAGPRTYELVSARIGSSVIQTADGGTFGVSLEKLPTGLLATLEIRVIGDRPVTLHYLSSQEYDLAIRSADGNKVWHWSADKLFLAVVRDETTTGRSWSVRVPLTDLSGTKLPAGKYQLEAWIASGFDEPEYAAVAPFEIPEVELSGR